MLVSDKKKIKRNNEIGRGAGGKGIPQQESERATERESKGWFNAIKDKSKHNGMC